MKTPELLGPGGSFDSALYALERGADAVYLGLTAFSARAAASNFTFDQLRRLRTYSQNHGKKIYVALNTLIKEEEWPQIQAILYKLNLIGVDALILQDLGLINYIQEHFPHFRLHGSTQLAAHNHYSVEILQSLGLSRIVLPRELSLAEIRDLVSSHEDMEFEVFIHGALCFGFSGMCLASGMLLGRSGNRGSCGQVCRTWFEGPKGKGYYFSTRDLALEEDVQKLADLGVHSLKIEGRMKSPEYAGLASAYYRKCLDREESPEKARIAEKLQLLFARKRTRGFTSPSATPKIDRHYASHLGVKLGQVLESTSTQLMITLNTDLAVRDGLMYLPPGEVQKPLKWAVSHLSQDGQKTTKASPKSTIRVNAPEKIPPGAPIYKISAHDLTWKSGRHMEFPPQKTGFELKIKVFPHSIELSATFPGLEKWLPTFKTAFDLEAQEARNSCDLSPILEKIFSQSDQVLFVPAKLDWENHTQWQDDRIFLPLSLLKQGRKVFYTELEAFVAKAKESFQNTRHQPAALKKHFSNRNLPQFLNTIERRELSPFTALPFITRAKELDPDVLAGRENWLFMPLSPLSLCSDLTPQAIEGFVKANADKKLLIGLNHYYQIEALKSLFQHENCYFFTDYLIYAANSWTINWLFQSIPRLLWVYRWIENSDSDEEKMNRSFPPSLVRTIEKDFCPTLFISRFCFSANSLEEKCCSLAAQDRIHILQQQHCGYRVIEQKGLCYVLKNK